MDSNFVVEARQAAEQSFSAGLYCAESAVNALARGQGIDSDLLPRIATAFCGGMARTCGPCGALTGALMGIGLALGRNAADGSVQPSYTAAQRLIRAFEEKFGARDCHVLLGCDLGTPEGQALFREQNLSRRCLEYTGTATELAARLIEESNSVTPPGLSPG